MNIPRRNFEHSEKINICNESSNLPRKYEPRYLTSLSTHARTFWWNDETTPFGGSTVDCLNDVDHLYYSSVSVLYFSWVTNFLFVVHGPVSRGKENVRSGLAQRNEQYRHLVIVTSAQINHDMLIPSLGCQYRWSSAFLENSPIEKHDSARIIQLIHLEYDQCL